MKKLLVICLLMCVFAASAEEMLPPGAEIIEETRVGSLKISILETPQGERLQFTCAGDVPTSLITIHPATGEQSGDSDRNQAETAVTESYPDARAFYAQEDAGIWTLMIFGENYCGSVLVQGDMIVSRQLEFRNMLNDNLLTLDGALSVLTLLRPEAQFRALELDTDDGLTLYEGDAYIGSAEYEFELDAHSGRLLEWERD